MQYEFKIECKFCNEPYVVIGQIGNAVENISKCDIIFTGGAPKGPWELQLVSICPKCYQKSISHQILHKS